MDQLPIFQNIQRGPAEKQVKMTKEEQEILKRKDEQFGASKAAKAPIKQMMEASHLSFNQILSDWAFAQRDIAKYGPAIYVPVTFQTVASIQAQLNGRPPRYRLSPQNTPQDREKANFVSKISQGEMKRAQAMVAISNSVQESLIFGTSFLRSVFRYDRRKMKFVKGVDRSEEGKSPVYEEREKVFYKGWVPQNDHPLCVYLPAVHEDDPSRWPFYIYRDLVDTRNVKAYYEAHPELAYKNVYKGLCAGGDLTDDLECLFKTDPMYDYYSMQRYPGSTRDALGGRKAQPYAQLKSENLSERLTIYDQENDEWTVVVAGRVVEHHPNPLEDTKENPITVMRDYKVSRVPWGIGEPHLLRYLQWEANALHTLALDGTKFTTAGVFGVNSAYLKNPADLSVYPGKIFDMKNMPGLTMDQVVKSFSTGDVKGSVFKMLQVNDGLAGRVTGIGSAVIGGDPINPNVSATDSNNLKAAASTRIYERARAIEQETMVDLVKKQLSFMAEMYDEELTVKLTDQEFYKFMPGKEADAPLEKVAQFANDGFQGVVFADDIAAGFDVVVEGESTLPISRSERRTEAMQLMKIATESRRPPTSQELAKDPSLPQKYPQGVPVLDANAVAEDILLPTFTSVDNIDELMWSSDDEGTGAPDRGRGVGRPPDALNPDTMAPAKTEGQIATEGGPQPADMGVNQMERVDQAA
ncbi:MAG TPA: hypothetical protein PLS35_02270 [Nitrospira sp.]|nr:hypothetical protein [Nitrospira sp.]